MAQTVGPADEKAGLRAKLYAVLAALLGIVGVAQSFGVLDAVQSASIGQIVTAVAALLGGGGFVLASAKTQQQVKDGTFQEAPDIVVPEPSAAISAVQSIGAIANEFNNLVTGVTDGVKTIQDTVGGLTSVLPGLAGIALPTLDPNSLAYKAMQAAQGRATATADAVAPSPTPGGIGF